MKNATDNREYDTKNEDTIHLKHNTKKSEDTICKELHHYYTYLSKATLTSKTESQLDNCNGYGEVIPRLVHAEFKCYVHATVISIICSICAYTYSHD